MMKHSKKHWIRGAGATLLASVFMLPFSAAAFAADPVPPTPEADTTENISLPDWDSTGKISLSNWADEHCSVEISPSYKNTPIYFHSELLAENKGLKTWLGMSTSYKNSWMHTKTVPGATFSDKYTPGADNSTGVCLRIDRSTVFEMRQDLAFPVAVPIYFGANFKLDLASDSFRKKFPNSLVWMVARHYAAYPEAQRDSVLFLKQSTFKKLGTNNIDTAMSSATRLSHLNEFPPVKSENEYVAAMIFTAPGIYTLDFDAYLLADSTSTTAMAKETMRYTFVVGKNINLSDVRSSNTTNQDSLPKPDFTPNVVPPDFDHQPSESEQPNTGEAPREGTDAGTEPVSDNANNTSDLHPNIDEQPPVVDQPNTEDVLSTGLIPSTENNAGNHAEGTTHEREPKAEETKEKPAYKPAEKPVETSPSLTDNPVENPKEQPVDQPVVFPIPVISPKSETVPDTKTDTPPQPHSDVKADNTPKPAPRELTPSTQLPLQPALPAVPTRSPQTVKRFEPLFSAHLNTPAKFLPAPDKEDSPKINSSQQDLKSTLINESYPAQPDIDTGNNTGRVRPVEPGLAWETQASKIVLISGIVCSIVGGGAVTYLVFGGKLFKTKLPS